MFLFLAGCPGGPGGAAGGAQGGGGQGTGGQTPPPAVGAKLAVDAIAVWQHQGKTFDIYYSLYSHDAKKWYTPSGKISEPIAVDEGDDHDADVSSNDKAAVAAWSKAKDNKSYIYYSLWESSKWAEPKKLSAIGSDTDPTVAVEQSGNAMAVWVSEGKKLHYAYYKKASGWGGISQIQFGSDVSFVSLPEVAYGESGGTYYLVFTGQEGDSVNAYTYEYSGSRWVSSGAVSDGAMMDNKVPTDERTGIAAAKGKKEATAVWPASAGGVHSVEYKGDELKFADGSMPDGAYDSADVANGVFSKSSDLYYQSNVNSPAAEKIVSSLKKENRASLTFIRERKIGLAVWWTASAVPGEIFYSYYEDGKWSAPSDLDPSLKVVLDRNPAVTPLALAGEKGSPFCGDAVLTPPEQCEVGIACANPNQICNVATCACKDKPKNKTYCGDAILQPPEQCEVGIACANPVQVCNVATCICKQNITWCGDGILTPPEQCEVGIACAKPGEKCFLPNCVCRAIPPPPPPPNSSCVQNTEEMVFGTGNPFNPVTMKCQDDCLDIGPGWKCTQNCVCKADISCADNTNALFGGWFDPAIMACKDDCKRMGDNYKCNAQSCTCEPITPPPTSCSKNTWVVNYPWDTIQQGAVCKDDCKTLNENYVCDPQGCFCKETRTVTPRCGDGYVSSPNVAGGGFEECDVGFGFYQPKDANGNPITKPDTCQPPKVCDAATCKCKPPITENVTTSHTVCDYWTQKCVAVPWPGTDECSPTGGSCSQLAIPRCGNNMREGAEYCDGTDKGVCTALQSCSSNCTCIGDFVYAPRCGNKIKEANEQCDGSSTGCFQGQSCSSSCTCISDTLPPYCGNGIKEGNEQCDGSAAVCDYPNSRCNSQCQCEHSVCGNGIKEIGEACDSSSDCITQISGKTVQGTCTSQCSKCEYTLYCGDGIIYPPEQCEQNSDCSSGKICSSCQCVPIPTHTVCQEFSCVEVQGAGSNQCSTSADCRPPVVDCQGYCSGEGYSQVLTTEAGGQYSSQTACQAAAQEEPLVCTTLCIYTKFYTSSNQAGSTTCCCKHKVSLSCDNCPAVLPSQPICPPQSACDQYAPGGG